MFFTVSILNLDIGQVGVLPVLDTAMASDEVGAHSGKISISDW